MRTRFAEFGHEYESYSFGYTVHGVRETEDRLADIYTQGFLPYSSVGTDPDLFYMSRSVRVPVASYVPSSENRRILRKFEGQFECAYIEGDALRASPDFRTLMLTYFTERHGAHVMPPERLEQILARDLPLRAAVYSANGTPVAYVLEVTEDSFMHYWYSCYDLAQANSSFGMWLMLDAVRRASEDRCTHLYLGTAYGDKARYKTNIPGLEYWDGNTWQADTHRLIELMKHDKPAH